MLEPARLTMELWSSLLLSHQDQEEKNVQDPKLAEVVPIEGQEEQERAILQDVTRTRSGTPALRDEKVLQWLQRSVSLFCRERGLQYAQGLTELAAPWALITDPPCLGSFSYRCFCSFVDRFAPSIFSTSPEDSRAREGRGTFVVLETHLILLEQLLRFHDPTLAAHLDKCCVSPAAYATPWFVTVFARQLPVPALLHLWQRLVEYGDPVLHQFLALAWLVNSRRVLLDAPREDVPKAASMLRLRSTQDVDDLFGAAVALRAGTPRLVSRTLRRACYDGAIAQGKPATACRGARAAGDVVEEKGPAGGNDDDEPASSDTTASAVTAMRVFLLEDLRAAGVLLVDADQVAEILLAQRSPGPPLTPPESEEDDQYLGAARNGRRFVLVDCRATGRVRTGTTEVAVRAREELAGGRVVWRRIPPVKSFGREAAAAAAILREFGAGTRGTEGREVEVVDSVGPCKLADNEEVSSGVVSAPYGAGGPNGRAANGSGGSAASSAGPYAGIHEVNVATAVDAAVHLCFIGSGNGDCERERSSRNNGAGGLSFAPTTATATGDSAPEFRLARAASRSCLAAHVCVLEGGFIALDEALSRRGCSPGGGTSGREGAGGTESSQTASRLGSADGIGHRRGEAAPAGVPGAGLPSSSGVTDQRRAALAGGGGSGRAGGGGSPGSPPFSLSRGVERKASRLAGNRRVSEPFRVYAAKSADEMGRALRSLPLAASKPLEDAARLAAFDAPCLCAAAWHPSELRTMGRTRKVSLQLPPNLEDEEEDEEGPSRETVLQGPVLLLLPQAMKRLRELCSVEELKLGRVVRRGGTSCVRWTERSGTHKKYATKVFNTLHPEHLKLLSAELRVLLEVDCPCVVQFYGAWVDEINVNLALEAMFLGSLFDMIYAKGNPCFSCPPGVLRWRNRSAGGGSQQDGWMDERAVLAVAFQIFWGLRYLHSKEIAHRDVKPSNVLADTSGSVKLADFGTALFLKEDTNDVMGTFRYMPPESAQGKAGDVWAAGLVVAEVFAHDLPFKACNSHVRECLTLDPNDRPSASQLLLSDTFSGVGIRTPEQSRKAVREWLYHDDDHGPPQVQRAPARAVSPGLQAQRWLAAAAEATSASGTYDHTKSGPGKPNSSSDGSLSTGNDGAGGVDQRAMLRHLSAASHGSRGNNGDNGDIHLDRVAERTF
eukprot:g13429.t1